MLLKSNCLYAYKGELLEYSHETINGYVFQHKARERVELNKSQIVHVTEVNNQTHTTMMTILEKQNDMIHIHVSYSETTYVLNLADALIEKKVVDVDDVRFNRKTNTAVIVAKKDVNYNVSSINELAQ